MFPLLLSVSAWSNPSSPGSSRWQLSLGAWGLIQGCAPGLQPDSDGKCGGHNPVNNEPLFYHHPGGCSLIVTSRREISTVNPSTVHFFSPGVAEGHTCRPQSI